MVSQVPKTGSGAPGVQRITVDVEKEQNRPDKVHALPGAQMRGTWGTQLQWINSDPGTWATRQSTAPFRWSCRGCPRRPQQQASRPGGRLAVVGRRRLGQPLNRRGNGCIGINPRYSINPFRGYPEMPPVVLNGTQRVDKPAKRWRSKDVLCINRPKCVGSALWRGFIQDC